MPARESHRTRSPCLSSFYFCDKIPGGKKAMNWAGRRKGGLVGGRAEDGREGLFKKEYSPSPCGAATDCPHCSRRPRCWRQRRQSGSIRRGECHLLSLLSHFYSLPDPSPWDSATHIPVVSNLSYAILKTPSQTHRWRFPW